MSEPQLNGTQRDIEFEASAALAHRVIETQGVWTEESRSLLPGIAPILRDAAASSSITENDLTKQVLLHLPRFDPGQLQDLNLVAQEIRRLAHNVRARQVGFESWRDRVKRPRLDRQTSTVVAWDSAQAQQIYRRFHYIGARLNDMVHLGLVHDESADLPMALASISTMDISNLDHLFPTPADRAAVLVISRVFAFDWASRNSISFLLGRVHRWVRTNAPKVDRLISYVNPNIGFSGSSYIAANWVHLASQRVRYMYLNGDYITYRAYLELSREQKATISYSQWLLEPLQILQFTL